MKMRKSIFAIAVSTLLLSSAAWADRIVIVHGAFQNAEAWSTVAKLLTSKGHEVEVVDLPGRDAKGDLSKVNLAAYRDAVRVVVDAKQEPVFLVGHSFGGFTISNVAESDAAMVKKLIYVAAYVPKSGESMQALSAMDKTNKFTQQNFVLAADYSYAEVLETDRGLIFANDGTPEVQAQVTKMLLREPLAPIAEPLTLSAIFEAVPKAFIRTARDNALSATLQDMMIGRAGIKQVVNLDTGHSPFITVPEKTAEAILSAMGK
jgi:pimeloyl-ACP methyl ester carboxylesterase